MTESVSYGNDITLIYGPMFSGKTTKLIHMYNDICSSDGADKCLAINYALDKRYGVDKIVTHDGKYIKCHAIESIDVDIINDTKMLNLIIKSQYIFINEAQFFEGIDKFVLFFTQKLKKNVILCGLDLDFRCAKFGVMMDLLPYATTVHKLTGKCNTADCIHPSEYSHRIVSDDSQILIGSSEYIPLCKNCYEVENVANH